MNILATDCSSFSLSICIAKDDRIIYSSYLNTNKTHSETIMPNIEYALAQAKYNINDIDVFGITVGPGSYTGLRIGAATVKAFAQVTNKPIAAISSLKALAVQAIPGGKYICPILDAKNDQIYSALYSYNYYVLSSKIPDGAFNIDDLLERLNSYDIDEDIIFVGDGALYHSNKIRKALGNKAIISNETYSIIDAKNVASLAKIEALNGETINYLELELTYLRKPQAERELENRL